MAIYSLHHGSVGKRSHAPGTAAAHIEYVLRERAAREVLADLPEGVEPSRLSAAAWMRREELADRANARLIDKVMVALPRELSPTEQTALLDAFCRRITGGQVPWLAAIHRDHPENPHAHIVVRDRAFGTGKRVLRWNTLAKGAATQMLREAWEQEANRALERAGHDLRLDCRSYEKQGVDKTPGRHLGAAHALEAKNARTRKGEHNRAISAFNRDVDAFRAELVGALGATQRDLANLGTLSANHTLPIGDAIDALEHRASVLEEGVTLSNGPETRTTQGAALLLDEFERVVEALERARELLRRGVGQIVLQAGERLFEAVERSWNALVERILGRPLDLPTLDPQRAQTPETYTIADCFEGRVVGQSANCDIIYVANGSTVMAVEREAFTDAPQLRSFVRLQADEDRWIPTTERELEMQRAIDERLALANGREPERVGPEPEL